MQAIFAKGNQRTVNKIISLRKEALADHQYRVATRLHAIILSIEKHTSGDIASLLKVHRTNVSVWINNWNHFGADGLLEGHRSGRRSGLSPEDKVQLGDIIESGPVAYGLNTGVWTSKVITHIIEEEFGIGFHPGHVRKLLKEIGFSVQRPTYKLVNADSKKRNKWIRYTYPNLKKNARTEGAIIVYGDEASFRQSPTLHQTWAPLNAQPKILSTGQRNSQKIFGAVELYSGNFLYKHKEANFNSETYIEFLEEMQDHYYKKGHRIYLIQDNASYHKKPETYAWFTANRKYMEVFNLPPYCPELNSTERIWHYTRMQATHNRYYDTKEELCNALFLTFKTIQEKPNLINGLLKPFF